MNMFVTCLTHLTWRFQEVSTLPEETKSQEPGPGRDAQGLSLHRAALMTSLSISSFAEGGGKILVLVLLCNILCPKR